MKKLMILAFLLVFLIPVSLVSGYTLRYKMQNTNENPSNVADPSVQWAEYCTPNISIYTTAGALGGYTLVHHLYSPNTNEVATATVNRAVNITCQNHIYNFNASSFDGSSLNGFYETASSTTFSSYFANNWLNVTYECGFDSDDLFIYKDTLNVDSFGNYPFAYGESFRTACNNLFDNDLDDDVALIIDYLQEGYYTQCGADMIVDRIGNGASTCNPPATTKATNNYWTMTPFNSMATGIVNISILETEFVYSGDCLPNPDVYEAYIYDYSENSTQLIANSYPYSGQTTLTPDKNYWLLIGTQARASKVDVNVCSIQYNHTDYNITIWAYEPDWVCGNWSECESGTKQRTCTDPSGKVPAKIEEEVCLVLPEEEILIGFENFTNQNQWVCDFWRNGLCANPFYPEGGSYYHGVYQRQPNRRYPNDWYYINPNVTDNTTGQYGFLYDFIDMTTSDSTQGELSLKMWYIPPKSHLPDFSPVNDSYVICSANVTQGRTPAIGKDINTSEFWLYHNITALSPYMRLTFDSRTCLEPEKQHGKCWYDIFNHWYFTEDWYSGNGSQNYRPLGNILLTVTDITNGTNTTFDDIIGGVETPLTENNWNTFGIELTNMQINNTYRIGLSVPPKYGNQDDESYCALIDNMRIQFYETAPICFSECVDDFDGDGVNDYTYKKASDKEIVCQYEFIKVSPNCVPEGYADDILEATEPQGENEDDPDYAERKKVCIGSTLFEYDDNRQDWVVLENAPYCDEQESETVAIASLFDPPLIMQPLLASFEGTFLWFIFSVLMIVTYFSLGLSVTIGYFIKSWEAFVIVFGSSIGLFGVAGFYHPFATIIIVFICSIMLATQISRVVG